MLYSSRTLSTKTSCRLALAQGPWFADPCSKTKQKVCEVNLHSLGWPTINVARDWKFPRTRDCQFEKQDNPGKTGMSWSPYFYKISFIHSSSCSFNIQYLLTLNQHSKFQIKMKHLQCSALSDDHITCNFKTNCKRHYFYF